MQRDLAQIHINNDQKAQVCGILSVGCDWHTAANFVGCSLADLRRAVDHDPRFAADVRRSEATAELGHMRIVQEAAKDVKNWRAATWWLERHAPERFGPRSAGAVTARQLKAYIGVLADVLAGGEEEGLDRRQIIERLKTFAESIDQLLRNERMLEPNLADMLPADFQGSAGAADDFSGDFEDAEFDAAE